MDFVSICTNPVISTNRENPSETGLKRVMFHEKQILAAQKSATSENITILILSGLWRWRTETDLEIGFF